MMLPVVLTLLLSASPSEALIGMTRSLGEAGVLPKTNDELQEITTKALSPSFSQAANAPMDTDQWTSEDERCFAELAPVGKITYGCRFASALEGGAFLRSAAMALAHPLRPPFPLAFADELHHRATMTIDHILIGAEFHLVRDEDDWMAAVVLTPGRRVVIRSVTK